jgi:hypothetical protein
VKRKPAAVFILDTIYKPYYTTILLVVRTNSFHRSQQEEG